MRHLFPAAFVFIASLCLATTFLLTPAFVHAERTLRVGIYDFKPLVYQDEQGKARGIYVDLLNAISRNTDWTPAYVRCNWPQCLEWLQQGRIDLLTGILRSPERAEKFAFSQVSVLSTWGQLYAAPGEDIQTFRDLEGKSIAVVEKGYFYPKLRQYLEEFNVNARFVRVESYKKIFRLTARGEVDACSAERVTGLQAEKRLDLRKTPLIYNHKNFLFAAPRGREGILQEIDTELRRLKEGEGSLYDQVLQKHLFARQEGKSLPGWVPWVLVVGGILLVVTFALNLSIRRLLRNRTAQLRQREQDLALTLNSIGDAVLVADALGLVQRMNPVAETLTGWPLAEAKGRPLREVFRITDAATGSICDDPVQRVLQSGTIQGLANHTVLISSQGEEQHISDSAAPIRDEQGRITGVVLIFRDVSERKQMEEALRESEQRYRGLFQNIRDAILLTDTDRRIIDCNPAFESLFGYSLEEIKGKKTSHVYESESEFRELGRALREHSDDSSFLMTVQYKKKSGEVFPGETGAFYLKDSTGGVAGFIGVIRDVTDRKQAEEALRKREEHLQAILQAAPDPLVVYDSVGHPQYINPSFTRVFGWDFQELQGGRIPFVPEDQKESTMAKIREIYRTGVPVSFDTKRWTKDQRLLDIRVSAAII